MAVTSTRHRQRRPSGDPPPLPRESKALNWLWATAAVIAAGIALGVVVATTETLHEIGGEGLEWLARIRTPFLTGVAKAIALVTSFGAVQILRVLVAAALIVTKRFRALVVALVSFVLVDWLVLTFLNSQRPAPGVTALVENANYTFPSWYVTAFAITAFAIPFLLVPAGPRRKQAMAVAWVAVGLDCLARLYLGVDYPTNVLYAAVLCWVLCEAAYRWFVPDEAFPVSYSRGGNAAHLDLSGPRAAAVKEAMLDELGFEVAEVKPFGLAGSGGSSPLLMTMTGGDRVFGKIYATSHVRADRWYRIGRTILYGKLEDETPFTSVRRLAEYEDYALRVLAMNDVKVAQTWGIVELTPNREYMLVTEFFEDSKNLGDSEVDDAIIDEGLQLIRQFWDIGVAHRDVKPANLLVQRGHLQLVDVSGLEVRPTPWRQAVDLANMMLTLALQSDPDRVYERATRVFAPDEIGEAFACATGLAIPTELSARLKKDPRPLMARFKELAPSHDPVSIQRWSLQRIALAAGAAVGSLVLIGMAIDSLLAGLR
jgi:membrane-associated phospholipid phosphatase/tRNA A-37 threonylcarbamoyl transferase component Bud32